MLVFGYVLRLRTVSRWIVIRHWPCIILHWFHAWNFPSSCLLAAPQWRNALAGAAVVVMLSVKRRGGGITFQVFLLVWLWPWPDDLHIRTWPVCSEYYRMSENELRYVEAFENYRLKVTDIQTDTAEIISTAAWWVVIKVVVVECRYCVPLWWRGRCR